MTTLIEDIKLKIKEILQTRKMSIYNLAIKADVSEACIRNWYSKRNYIPNLESLIKICNALDISLSHLFATKDETLYPVNNETRNLLELWLKLDNPKRELVYNLINTLANN